LRFIVDVEKGKPTCKSGKVLEVSNCPYVAEAFPEKWIDERIETPVLSIERTFLEKASILHSEAHRPLEKMIPDRYSRHYADVAALAQTENANSALHRDELRARVIAHKQVFYPAVWAHTETAVPGTFCLMPQKERSEILARDYAQMRDMFFCEPPPWNEILDGLKVLEMRINAPSSFK
jgi:hypothetical protein